MTEPTATHNETAEVPEGLPAPDGSSDPWQWLEDVTGEDALAWVRERNAAAEAEIDEGGLAATLQDEIRTILDASDKIPGVTLRGEHLYNFWTDAEHERGLWRRTTWDSYRSETPEWDVLLDVDALNAAEDEDWVWHGAQLLRPAEGEPYRRALVNLSHGGSDADVTREFDLEARRFVPASEGGFERPESKGSISWIDEDTLWVATDMGEGSMTTSGYPRQVRRWTRGDALTDAALVFEADETDMLAAGFHDSTPGYERDWILRYRAFRDNEQILVRDTGEDEQDATTTELVTLDVPRDMDANAHRDIAYFLPRSDWHVDDAVYPAGSLVVGDLERFLAGERDLTMLFEPTPTTSLEDVTFTRNTIVLTVLEDVVHRLEVHQRDAQGAWLGQDLYPDLPGSLQIAAVDADEDDRIWVSATGFLEPTTLSVGDLGPVTAGEAPGELELVKSTPARFDADGLTVSQYFATSDDGTTVPYFWIGPTGERAAEDSPTLLYGYGGFEISMTPAYLGAIGKAWLERGGAYVVANIRGGGEYGPAWHQAALTEHRHRAYEDFSSVAKDLIDRGLTTSERLAVRGGSNGGLLTGNMVTQYPELFGAVVIQVPLLDMKRYNHLLAGASWMAEYGDPDTDDWEFIRTFSPYHLLDAAKAEDYPPTFVLTSTRDDRVHPGHARKFTAAMESLGADVRSWENIEGGHGGAATNDQAARMNALIYTFLWRTIGSGLERTGTA
ncbi:MAG: prolyl oligopeptidase family serine peptidase [Brachybacterium sp.]|nr:prolyl oligopeptidase family serine peptidase [Brachybacterium sp.]